MLSPSGPWFDSGQGSLLSSCTPAIYQPPRTDHTTFWGFPDGSNSKESTCNAGDLGSIPGLRSYPGKGNDNPLQRIPWTEECGGLQSMGLQRVGHNWETNTSIFYFKEEQVSIESLKLFYLKNYHENKKYLYIKLFCILYIFQTMGYYIIITSKSTYKILDFSLYWVSLVSLNFQVYIVLEWLTHSQSGSKY